MDNSPKLLLVNNYQTDLEVNLLFPKGRRVLTIGCRVPVGQAVDVCARLNLPKMEARAIVEASPDYITMFSRGRMVELVDVEQTVKEETTAREEKRRQTYRKLVDCGITPSGILVGPPEGMSTEKYEKVLDKMFETPPPRPVYVPDEVKVPAVQAAPIVKNEVPSIAAAELPSETLTESTITASSSEALEPGVREALSDAIPSTRWSKEKLLEHARSKNLDVSEEMSKNALLRKIRGA